MPLFPLNWTIAMIFFTTRPLLKYRNLKDYKKRPPDLLREQKNLIISLQSLLIFTCSLQNIVLSSSFFSIPIEALHGLAPDYLANLLTFYKPVRTLRSSKFNNLSVPRSRTSTYGERSFACVAPRLWSQLPDFIRYSETLDSFKIRLKNCFQLIVIF